MGAGFRKHRIESPPHLHVDISHQALDVFDLPLGLVVAVALLHRFELVQFEQEDLLGLFGVQDGTVVPIRDKVKREGDEHVQFRKGTIGRAVDGREDFESCRVLFDGRFELFCGYAKVYLERKRGSVRSSTRTPEVCPRART